MREEPGLAVPETERIMLILAVPDRVGLVDGEFGVLEERLRKPASAFKKKGAVLSDVVVSYPELISHRQMSITFTPWAARKSTKGGKVKLVQL